jgi:hypothetical protein
MSTMIHLQATVAFPYAGRSLAAGENFTATQKDADLLKKIGRAVDAPQQRPRLIRPRDLEPEESATIDTPKPKRQYRRRDLEPEP